MSELSNTYLEKHTDVSRAGAVDALKQGVPGFCYQTPDQAANSPLDFNITPVNYMNDTGRVEYDGSEDEGVADDDDNFIYVNAAGALVKSTGADFPAPAASQQFYCAKIVAAGGLITEIHNFNHPSGQ